ncbi:MAG: PIG-L family deacetylase [Bryobacteraceae bacterium]
MPKTVLAIGAHYDDCVFGIPGILLQAVRKHHRVVILTLIDDYSNFPPVKDRWKEMPGLAARLAKEHGVESRFLNFKSHHFDVNLETKRAVSQAVADIGPDIAFHLWRSDRHNDHQVASQLSEIALRNAHAVLDRSPIKLPREIYAYDNGPRHTIGFEPDTFVDTSAEWKQSIDWLGKLMAMVRNEPYDPAKHDASQQTKEAIAAYRGKTCGVAYAEALATMNYTPRDIL